MTTMLLGTFALPFGLALLVALVGWTAGAGRRGAAVALGVAVGLLAGEAAVAGWPALPPQGAIDKLPWLALGGGLLGFTLEAVAQPRRRIAATALAAASALVWIGWPRLMIPDTSAWAAAALLLAGATWALVRLEEAGSAGGALLLVVGAFAAAGVAAYGSSYAMAQVIAVLATALAGAMAGAGASGSGLGGAGRLAAGLPLIALVAMLALYTRAAPLALVLLLPVFLAEGALRRYDDLSELAARLGARGGGAARLGLVLALALVPACAAVAVAVWRSGPLYY